VSPALARAARALAVSEALRVVVEPVVAGGVAAGLLQRDLGTLDLLHRAPRLNPAVDRVAGGIDELHVLRILPRGRVGGILVALLSQAI